MDNGEQLLDEAALLAEASKPAPSEIFLFGRRQPDGSIKTFRVRVRLLSVDETLAALAEAQQEARNRKELPKEYGDVYRELQAVCVLRRCVCYLEVQTRSDGTQYYRPLCVDNDQLLKMFGEHELSALLNMHEIVKAKYSFMRSFDEDEIDMWAARLSDPERAYGFLASLDSSAWPELLMSLAQRVASLSESLGQPLPSWRGSFESNAPTSENGTGGSTESPPDVQIEVSEQKSLSIPSDRLLTQQEAQAMAEQMSGDKSDDK